MRQVDSRSRRPQSLGITVREDWSTEIVRLRWDASASFASNRNSVDNDDKSKIHIGEP